MPPYLLNNKNESLWLTAENHAEILLMHIQVMTVMDDYDNLG